MPKNIAYYLELEDEEFDLDGAVELLRDLKVELAPHQDLQRYLGKLETRIKHHIRTTGQAPNVKGLRMNVIPKRDTEYVTVVDVQKLAGRLMATGENEIAQQVLALVRTKENTPAIKFIYEDLEYK